MTELKNKIKQRVNQWACMFFHPTYLHSHQHLHSNIDTVKVLLPDQRSKCKETYKEMVISKERQNLKCKNYYKARIVSLKEVLVLNSRQQISNSKVHPSWNIGKCYTTSRL